MKEELNNIQSKETEYKREIEELHGKVNLLDKDVLRNKVRDLLEAEKDKSLENEELRKDLEKKKA